MNVLIEVVLYLGWSFASVVVPLSCERLIRRRWTTKGVYSYEKDVMLVSTTSALIVFVSCSPFLYYVFAWYYQQ